MSEKDSKTDENLKGAFKGESYAHMKYMAYAQQAEDEGEPQISKIFKTAAKAERVHALNQMAAQGWVPTSKENLEDAIQGETDECTEVYPKFIETAREENRAEAVTSLKWVKQVEEIHKEMFEDALEKLEEDEELGEKDYYVCMNCGYPEEGAPPKSCPICGAPKSMFEEVK